jgi:hypothetical protein
MAITRKTLPLHGRGDRTAADSPGNSILPIIFSVMTLRLVLRHLFLPVTLWMAAVPAGAGAQATPPKLELTERLRLDAATEDFSAFVMNRQGNSPFYVGPRGTVVLPLPQDGNIRIYDSTGKRVTTLGRKGAGPGEFRSIFRVGWTHDTLWVYDALQRRMTYYDRDWKLLRSSVYSDALKQAPEGPNPTNVISDFAPSAISPSGNSLGQIILVNGRDPVLGRLLFTYHLASVGPNGEVTQFGEIPPSAVSPRAWVGTETAGRSAFAIVPFANDALFAFATAGDRFAMVTTNRAARTFTVTARSAKGDTLFSRAYPYAPRAIPSAVADSAATAATKNARQSPAVISALQAETRKAIPPSYPPVASIVLARDGSTWVRTTDGAGNDQAMVLDGKGNVTAVVPLRRGIDIVEAEGRRVWAVDVDDDDLASIVVFTVGAPKR